MGISSSKKSSDDFELLFCSCPTCQPHGHTMISKSYQYRLIKYQWMLILPLCLTLMTLVLLTALPRIAADQTIFLYCFFLPGKCAFPTFWAVLPLRQNACSADFPAPSHSQHGVRSRGLHMYEYPKDW